MGLKKRELKTLKEKIEAEIARVNAEFSDYNDEELHANSDDRFDEVDQAASEYERSQLLRFRNRNTFYIKKLKDALMRFEHDEYGICTDCDCDIKYERLLARPTAELCITCKDEAEKEEQGSFTGRQSKSFAKTHATAGAM